MWLGIFGCVLKNMNEYSDFEELTPLEQEFLSTTSKLIEEFKFEVRPFLDAAEAELDKAVAVAEKHGLPLSTSISFIYNRYVPKSFYEKYSDEQRVLLKEYELCWGSEYETEGWIHSMVC